MWLLIRIFKIMRAAAAAANAAGLMCITPHPLIRKRYFSALLIFICLLTFQYASLFASDSLSTDKCVWNVEETLSPLICIVGSEPPVRCFICLPLRRSKQYGYKCWKNITNGSQKLGKTQKREYENTRTKVYTNNKYGFFLTSSSKITERSEKMKKIPR